MPARSTMAALVAFFLAAARLSAADVELDDLRPGLVATYRDGAKPPVEIVRLEPTVALTWKTGETAHPRLAAGAGGVEWTGYLNVLRAGTYRFSAIARGKVKVAVAGKDVLTGEVEDATPQPMTGPEVRLEAGIHPFTATFTRLPLANRLELFWQGPGFRKEPLPGDYLGHVPAKAPAALAADQLAERGRFLAEERNCLSCHLPEKNDGLAKGLASRPAPDLSQVGGRASPGWLLAWVNDPHKVRPGATMPKVFADDAAGKAEAHAVARYLSSLGGPAKVDPKPPNPNDVKNSIASGKRLFVSVGCVACHKDGPAAKEEPASLYNLANGVGGRQNFPLVGLGSKTTPEKLAAYLQNPHAIDPSGRMPNLLLEGKEANDLARFLCESTDNAIAAELPAAPDAKLLLAAFKRIETDADALKKFEGLGGDAQLLDLGKRLLVEKGCVSCHAVAPDKKPLTAKPASSSFAATKQDKTHAAGCLADDAAKRGTAPAFTFSNDDRKALRRFLTDGATGAGSPAPAYLARISLQRFNCLACHQRDGEGGLTTDITDLLRQFEKAENAEAVSPPPLTGVGHKLRTSWIKQVLTQKGRARPWMSLRMPQFGDAQVAPLAEALAALEGTEPDDTIHKIPLNAAKIEAGKQLVGKGAFGCISCHDLAGIANSGTRGPDLAGMNQRVRFDWYERWLEQAQRMQPGTRMPVVFPDGKSTQQTILEGKAGPQSEAIWAYLSLGPGLPLPDGIGPPKGLVLQVTDKPMLLRTFMPEAGSRAIAVGYPGGVSTAFDAQTCRLSYGWSGNFLDAAPVWDGRGGAPAKLLGTKFWTAPPGCPIATSDSNEPPDFTALRKDPAYGAALPEGQVYDKPKQLRFDGYETDKDGLPTFRYRLDANETNPVKVSERPEPLRNAVAFGVGRRFTLDRPTGKGAWLLAGESSADPRLLDAKGNPLTLDLAALPVELPTADRLIALPQGGDKVILLAVTDAPEGTKWVLQKQNGTWRAMLKLPPAAKAGEVKVGVNVWSPHRDEAALLKEMLSAK